MFIANKKSKSGNVRAFIYGKPVGSSRYVGSKKKRKVLKTAKKVVS